MTAQRTFSSSSVPILNVWTDLKRGNDMTQTSALPRRRRRARNTGAVKAALYIIMVFCMVAGTSVFFEVADVRVSGNADYSQQDIINAADIRIGSNLLFLNQAAVKSRVMNALPYVDDVAITRRAPSTVVLTISESIPLAYVELDGAMFIIDKRCKILGKSDMSGVGDLIRVEDIKPIKPSVGHKIAAGVEEASKLEYLTELLGLFSRREMDGSVSSVDAAFEANISFEYMGRFKVSLGKHEKLEYKLELLQSVIEKIDASAKGTIDLSEDREAHFIPS